MSHEAHDAKHKTLATQLGCDTEYLRAHAHEFKWSRNQKADLKAIADRCLEAAVLINGFDHFLRILIMELSDKIIALSAAAGDLQSKLNTALANALPPGSVAITQAAADAANARVADDGTIVPNPPAA